MKRLISACIILFILLVLTTSAVNTQSRVNKKLIQFSTKSEKHTETATKKDTNYAIFTKDEVEKLKEIVKGSPGKRSNYEIIYKIRSCNYTSHHSIRLSQKLLDQAKKKATSQKLTLQEFINLAIYEKTND